MEKKNFNLEVYFESSKKSFVILSKSEISLDEIKEKTIKEFNIPKEKEKNMRFFIIINNIDITLVTDKQILKYLEEITTNNYYLKIHFELKKDFKENKNFDKLVPDFCNKFNIIQKNANKNDSEIISKLKNEIEELKNKKNNNIR